MKLGAVAALAGDGEVAAVRLAVRWHAVRLLAVIGTALEPLTGTGGDLEGFD
jgi:hypothetical protein